MPDPNPDYFSIPDPGVRKAPDPGSATLSGRNISKKKKKLVENRDEPYAFPLVVSSLRERLGTGYP
jgi:hypothetical protein